MRTPGKYKAVESRIYNEHGVKVGVACSREDRPFGDQVKEFQANAALFADSPELLDIVKDAFLNGELSKEGMCSAGIILSRHCPEILSAEVADAS